MVGTGLQVITLEMSCYLILHLPCSLQENSTTCPATTTAPPSGLSTGGAIAIGIVFGLLSIVAGVVIAMVVVVVLVVMKHRGGGKRYL